MRVCYLFVLLAALLAALSTIFTRGEDPKRDIDPAFAAWYYPKADQIGSSTFAGKIHQTLFTTADDVPKVEGFYLKASFHPIADKLDRDKSPPQFSIHTSLGYPHPRDKDKQVLAMWGDDSKVRTDGEARGVVIRSMVYDTEDELVTVTMSRTPTEKTTHILLLCVKKK